ncbi:MAG: hypothetical protein PHS41_10005 [Victivallaceae bacterium]|nr:hypothetical protein [Victivallaceae bacterium]
MKNFVRTFCLAAVVALPCIVSAATEGELWKSFSATQDVAERGTIAVELMKVFPPRYYEAACHHRLWMARQVIRAEVQKGLITTLKQAEDRTVELVKLSNVTDEKVFLCARLSACIAVENGNICTDAEGLARARELVKGATDDRVRMLYAQVLWANSRNNADLDEAYSIFMAQKDYGAALNAAQKQGDGKKIFDSAELRLLKNELGFKDVQRCVQLLCGVYDEKVSSAEIKELLIKAQRKYARMVVVDRANWYPVLQEIKTTIDLY